MLATTLTTILRRQGAVEAPYVFSPSELFASGEEGVWYDPSDFTTLYTDTAGTTAITAVEQPVGYMSDKSGNGNHAVAANGSTARPVLRNRYNLLTYSEQFDNAYWNTASRVTVSANSITAPDGTTTADTITETASTGTHRLQANGTSASASGLLNKDLTLTVYAKKGTRDWLWLALTSGGGTDQVIGYFDVNNGAVGTASNVGNGANAAVTISSVGDGWYKCVLSGKASTSVGDVYAYIGITTGDQVVSYLGDASKYIYFWGAQLTTAADHDAINGEYQRIAAAPTVGAAPTYDDDVTKFPPYLYATTDDAMSTASIDFSGGDEMSVFAGVTKQSDAAIGLLTEFSADFNSNNGSFNLSPNSDSNTAAANSAFGSRGDASAVNGQYAVSAAFASPATLAITATGSISGDLSALRVNGASSGTNGTSNQGSGNYGNYPLYLFARNNSSLFYTGRLYSLIVRNALTSGDELDNVEAYVAQKTGVTL